MMFAFAKIPFNPPALALQPECATLLLGKKECIEGRVAGMTQTEIIILNLEFTPEEVRCFGTRLFCCSRFRLQA